MKPAILIALLFSTSLLFKNIRALGQSSTIATCNVVWDSPSKNSSGSMPLGNGDIGLNAWVEENGDLLFFISKTDSWSDAGRLLKLGQVRVRLKPSLAARPFRQELQLQNGQIAIQSGAGGSVTKLRLWVDANRPVIHIQGESQKKIAPIIALKSSDKTRENANFRFMV